MFKTGRTLPLAVIFVAGILAVITGLTWACSGRLSLTNLEPALLASGLVHIHQGEFEPYSVYPPLVKVLCALPLYVASDEVTWERKRGGRRPEFDMGLSFKNQTESVDNLPTLGLACRGGDGIS